MEQSFQAFILAVKGPGLGHKDWIGPVGGSTADMAEALKQLLTLITQFSGLETYADSAYWPVSRSAGRNWAEQACPGLG